MQNLSLKTKEKILTAGLALAIYHAIHTVFLFVWGICAYIAARFFTSPTPRHVDREFNPDALWVHLIALLIAIWLTCKAKRRIPSLYAAPMICFLIGLFILTPTLIVRGGLTFIGGRISEAEDFLWNPDRDLGERATLNITASGKKSLIPYFSDYAQVEEAIPVASDTTSGRFDLKLVLKAKPQIHGVVDSDSGRVDFVQEVPPEINRFDAIVTRETCFRVSLDDKTLIIPLGLTQARINRLIALLEASRDFQLEHKSGFLPASPEDLEEEE